MVVITGLSGSGKSSLAFDTLFAEGQRMYVESLSAYARQFLGRMEKPEVEYIKGVSPAIAIEQKVNTRNPRSTVGTTTEIYDYLKLLFARIGITYSPKTGKIVTKDSVSDVVDYVYKFDESSKLMILSPLRIKQSRDLEQELKILLSKGYSRLLMEDKVVFIEDLLQDNIKLSLILCKSLSIVPRCNWTPKCPMVEMKITSSVWQTPLKLLFLKVKGPVWSISTRNLNPSPISLKGMVSDLPNPVPTFSLSIIPMGPAGPARDWQDPGN